MKRCIIEEIEVRRNKKGEFYQVDISAHDRREGPFITSYSLDRKLSLTENMLIFKEQIEDTYEVSRDCKFLIRGYLEAELPDSMAELIP